MQGIYNDIPKTNHFSGVHNVAAVLYVQFFATCNVISPVKYVLFFYINIFGIKRATPNTAVVCTSLM